MSKNIDDRLAQINENQRRKELYADREIQEIILAPLLSELQLYDHMLAAKNDKIDQLEKIVAELLDYRKENKMKENKMFYATIQGLQESIKAQTIKIQEKDVFIEQLMKNLEEGDKL